MEEKSMLKENWKEMEKSMLELDKPLISPLSGCGGDWTILCNSEGKCGPEEFWLGCGAAVG